ncbi:UNVERIFIED_ORG: hypothetical protein B5F06_14975 [Lacrimispora saccharolytica]
MNERAWRYPISQLIVACALFFPISSMLKVYISPLNLMFTGALVFLIAIYYFKTGTNNIEVLLIGYSILIVISNCIQYNMQFYNDNMLLYFPVMIIYYLFMTYKAELVIYYIKKLKKYIDRIVYAWCISVGISFFMPSCYVYEGEARGFVSFAETTFLLSQIAIFVFALLCFQYILYRKRIYIYLMLVPSLAILAGSSRTYLIVLLCAWGVFLYSIIKNKKLYIFVISLFTCVALGIVLASPIMDKFTATIERVDTNGLDFWNAFTSGRSVFWIYDINAILHNSIDKILFGNGINYLFYLNEPVFHVALWAHNDFIQILSDYGLVGLYIYLYVILNMIKSMLRGCKKTTISMIVLVMLWAFNAFFNMFYTYFCATLSYPLYILLVRYGSSYDNNDYMVKLN